MLNRGVRGGLFNRRPITFVYFDGRPITFVYFDGRPITFVYFGIDEQRRSVGIKGRGGGRRECGRGEEGSFIYKKQCGRGVERATMNELSYGRALSYHLDFFLTIKPRQTHELLVYDSFRAARRADYTK